MTEHDEFPGTWRSTGTGIVFLLSWLGAQRPCLARATETRMAFVVVEAQFHARDPEDAGEVRLCLRNTGTVPLSMAQLRLQVTAQRPDSPDAAGTEHKCVFARLWPPVVPPGRYGQLVAKLFDRPAKDHVLTCTVSGVEGAASQPVPAREPAVWISYVGFSQDLHRIFVYVENASDRIVRLKSLQIGEDKVESPTAAIPRLVSPKDKGCLIGRLAAGITPGEFLPLIVSAQTGDQDVHVHSIVKAINKMPLMMVESGPPTPDLGLDLEGFTETMTCIAHAHGTHEQAASKFLEDYLQRFYQNSPQVIQVDICRSDSPRAWFRFGSLADVARMNPVLPPPPGYDKEDHKQWLHPFFYRGFLGKKAVEPCRYLAVMPLVPEEGLILQKELTPAELRFLVYCAVASGAKGLGYRGVLPKDPLQRSAFVRLNQELHQLEPLLLIGEPVEWTTTVASNYAAKSLLCGDQAILVLVFDRRYFSQQRSGKFYTPSFGRTVAPVQIEAKIPDEVSVGQVRSLSAPLPRSTWACRADGLRFTADQIDSVQVYLVDLHTASEMPERRESSR